jgi:hypothetical protein
MHENANKKGQHCDGACGAVLNDVDVVAVVHAVAGDAASIIVGEAGAGVVGSGVALHAVVLVVLLASKLSKRAPPTGYYSQAIYYKKASLETAIRNKDGFPRLDNVIELYELHRKKIARTI